MMRTLYITRNGLCEPLGQSQVMSYLRGLSQDAVITLITFEKPEDFENHDLMGRMRTDCAAHGIRWFPQRFRARPALIAPAFSMVALFWLCLREVRQGNAQLIHARSYVPAAVAWLVNRLKRTPFIFDMRALWPEELITAGRLRRGSFLHKRIVGVERQCLDRAAAVISLTHAAVDHLKAEYPRELARQRIVVIPTCADLDRFVPTPKTVNGPRVYGCLGTVLSGRFNINMLSAFLHFVSNQDSTARFEIVTRDDALDVRNALGGDRDFQKRLNVFAVEPSEAQNAIQQEDTSIVFFSEGPSTLGTSPTRMAEILGCGVPVVANAGVGDVGRIVTDYNVGVLLENDTAPAMQIALDALDVLWQDPALAARCRQAAEEVFSLHSGTEKYRAVYSAILSNPSGH